MKKLKFAVVIIVIFSLVPVCLRAAKVVLPEDTEVKLKFGSVIKVNSGMLQEGLEIPVLLAEDIKIGGKTIVEEGAEGKAKVTEIERASRPGDPGYIKISFTALGTKGDYKTDSGGMIKLSGEVENRGKSRKILSWVFILGLFIKGGEGEIDVSQVHTAKVEETVILKTG